MMHGTLKRDWIEKARCTTMEPGVFQSDEPEYDPQLALATCFDCPVRDLCLTEVLAEEATAEAKFRYGIQGGMLPAERASLDRKVRRTGTVPHARTLSNQEHAFRKEWHAQGLTDIQIGRLCNVQATTIQKWREKYGLERNYGHPHAAQSVITQRRAMVEQGLSNREIADKEGSHIDAIRSWRKRNPQAS